jgi:hypothetical protein
MALNFTVLTDGRVVVADLGHRAYQLFGADGEFDRMVSMGAGDEVRVGEMAPVPGTDAVISGGSGSVMTMSSGPGAAPPTTRPIERVSLAGDVIEVTGLADGWLPPRGDEPTRLEGGGMSLSMAVAGPRTFEPGLLVGALPDGGVAFADSTGYAIKVTGPDGELTRVLRRPFEPRPVTARMQEAERERRLEELESGGGPRMRMMTDGPGGTQTVGQDAINEMMRGHIAQMQFFPELPVLLDLRTSWTGRVWAQRRGDAPTEPGPIDVMTPEGDYLGTLAADAVDLPDAFGPEGLTAWIEEDDFGVPIIVVRRLPADLN